MNGKKLAVSILIGVAVALVCGGALHLVGVNSTAWAIVPIALGFAAAFWFYKREPKTPAAPVA